MRLANLSTILENVQWREVAWGMIEFSETVLTEVAHSFRSEVTIRFLQVLQNEFGDHLHIVLDNATYFTSKRVAEFVEESAIWVMNLPTGLPDMNPVKECWRHFKRRLSNRYFNLIDELRPAVQPAFDAGSPPNIYDFLYPPV